jgi:hypothetical protein
MIGAYDAAAKCERYAGSQRDLKELLGGDCRVPWAGSLSLGSLGRTAKLYEQPIPTPCFREASTIHRHMDEAAAEELGEMAKRWFEVMHRCGDDVREVLHPESPSDFPGVAASPHYGGLYRLRCRVSRLDFLLKRDRQSAFA